MMATPENPRRTRTQSARNKWERMQSRAITALRKDQPLPDQKRALMAVLDSLIRFRDQQKEERDKAEERLKSRRQNLLAMQAYRRP